MVCRLSQHFNITKYGYYSVQLGVCCPLHTTSSSLASPLHDAASLRTVEWSPRIDQPTTVEEAPCHQSHTTRSMLLAARAKAVYHSLVTVPSPAASLKAFEGKAACGVII
jgi:hypothetical protein